MKNKASQKRAYSQAHSRATDRIGRGSPRGIIPCSAAGALASIILILIMAIVLSYLLSKAADPIRLVTPTALCALYISALIGGFIATRLNKCSALLCGICVGTAIAALGFIISLTISDSLSSGASTSRSLMLRLSIIVCSVIGSYIGNLKKTPSKKRHNNYKKR